MWPLSRAGPALSERLLWLKLAMPNHSASGSHTDARRVNIGAWCRGRDQPHHLKLQAQAQLVLSRSRYRLAEIHEQNGGLGNKPQINYCGTSNTYVNLLKRPIIWDLLRRWNQPVKQAQTPLGDRQVSLQSLLLFWLLVLPSTSVRTPNREYGGQLRSDSPSFLYNRGARSWTVGYGRRRQRRGKGHLCQ